MKKLFQQLGLAKPTQGLLGIEIEAEGRDMNEVDSKYWRSENDGSLRGNYPETRAEFVLKKPIPAEAVVPALKDLIKSLPDAKFDFSFRTSVHVHVNVQDFTHAQIMNLVYVYFLLEEPLMTYCGKSRKANRFCLRLGDAEGLLGIVKKMALEGEGSHRFCDDNIRYSAINLAALNKYGSVEFRGMRGNIDIDVIHTWTRALVALHDYAEKQEAPDAIRVEFEKVGPVQFIKNVLGDELYAVFAYPKLLRDMSRSYSISLDLPYSYKKPKEVVVPVKRDIIFIEVGAGEHARIAEAQIEGQEIVYAGQHYRFEAGNFKPLGRWDGPVPVAPRVGARAVQIEEEVV